MKKVALVIDTCRHCRHFTRDESRCVIICNLHKDKKVIERGSVCSISYIPVWCPLVDAPEEPSLPAEGNNKPKPILNYCGDDAYYYCNSCGLELFGTTVGIVAAGNNYANGEFCACPECTSENSIERDDGE